MTYQHKSVTWRKRRHYCHAMSISIWIRWGGCGCNVTPSPPPTTSVRTRWTDGATERTEERMEEWKRGMSVLSPPPHPPLLQMRLKVERRTPAQLPLLFRSSKTPLFPVLINVYRAGVNLCTDQKKRKGKIIHTHNKQQQKIISWSGGERGETCMFYTWGRIHSIHRPITPHVFFSPFPIFKQYWIKDATRYGTSVPFRVLQFIFLFFLKRNQPPLQTPCE